MAWASWSSFSSSSSWSPLLVPRCLFRYHFLTSFLYFSLMIGLLFLRCCELWCWCYYVIDVYLGEGLAALPVIKRCVQRRPDVTVLLTTTTLSALWATIILSFFGLNYLCNLLVVFYLAFSMWVSLWFYLFIFIFLLDLNLSYDLEVLHMI